MAAYGGPLGPGAVRGDRSVAVIGEHVAVGRGTAATPKPSAQLQSWLVRARNAGMMRLEAVAMDSSPLHRRDVETPSPPEPERRSGSPPVAGGAETRLDPHHARSTILFLAANPLSTTRISPYSRTQCSHA